MDERKSGKGKFRRIRVAEDSDSEFDSESELSYSIYPGLADFFECETRNLNRIPIESSSSESEPDSPIPSTNLCKKSSQNSNRIPMKSSWDEEFTSLFDEGYDSNKEILNDCSAIEFEDDGSGHGTEIEIDCDQTTLSPLRFDVPLITLPEVEYADFDHGKDKTEERSNEPSDTFEFKSPTPKKKRISHVVKCRNVSVAVGESNNSSDACKPSNIHPTSTSFKNKSNAYPLSSPIRKSICIEALPFVGRKSCSSSKKFNSTHSDVGRNNKKINNSSSSKKEDKKLKISTNKKSTKFDTLGLTPRCLQQLRQGSKASTSIKGKNYRHCKSFDSTKCRETGKSDHSLHVNHQTFSTSFKNKSNIYPSSI